MHRLLGMWCAAFVAWLSASATGFQVTPCGCHEHGMLWHTCVIDVSNGSRVLSSVTDDFNMNVGFALQGSPVVTTVRQRLAGIEKEYNELDAVWFMAGSLFNRLAGQTHAES